MFNPVGEEQTATRPFTYEFGGLADREKDGYKYADEFWSQLGHGNCFNSHSLNTTDGPEVQQYVGIAPEDAHIFGLSPSIPSLSNASESAYLVSGYHQIHCLVRLFQIGL